MKTFKAIIRNGRLQIDIPVDLPDGTVVEVTVRAVAENPSSQSVKDGDQGDSAEREGDSAEREGD